MEIIKESNCSKESFRASIYLTLKLAENYTLLLFFLAKAAVKTIKLSNLSFGFANLGFVSQ